MMSLEFLAVIFTIAVAPCFVSGFLAYDDQFDYFTFAQSWPPGVCAAGDWEHHTCHIDKSVTTWTVHGVWPSVWSGQEPFYCNKSADFDIDKVSNILSQLNTFWPNLYTDTPHDSFWKHEWEKHGTCAMNVAATKDEYSFFKEGLSLNFRYNILGMLAKANIKPKDGAKYTFDQFKQAIQNFTGKEPVLGCANKNQDGEGYHMIEQIEICLDKSFQPVSCYDEKTHKPGKHGHIRKPQSNCPLKELIFYPPINYV